MPLSSAATPIRKALAVVGISAIPPGAAARIMLGRKMSPAMARFHAVPAESDTIKTMQSTIAATKRGAPLTNWREKRAPHAQPSKTFPALVKIAKIDEKAKPEPFTTIVATSEPIIQASGNAVQDNKVPPTAATAKSAAQLNAITTDWYTSPPCTSEIVIKTGTVYTTRNAHKESCCFVKACVMQ